VRALDIWREFPSALRLIGSESHRVVGERHQRGGVERARKLAVLTPRRPLCSPLASPLRAVTAVRALLSHPPSEFIRRRRRGIFHLQVRPRRGLAGGGDFGCELMIAFDVGLKLQVERTIVGRLAGGAVLPLIYTALALGVRLVHAEFDIARPVGVDPHLDHGLVRGPDGPPGPPFAGVQLTAVLR
jgi:hypothetical protein